MYKNYVQNKTNKLHEYITLNKFDKNVERMKEIGSRFEQNASDIRNGLGNGRKLGKDIKKTIGDNSFYRFGRNVASIFMTTKDLRYRNKMKTFVSENR